MINADLGVRKSPYIVVLIGYSKVEHFLNLEIDRIPEGAVVFSSRDIFYGSMLRRLYFLRCYQICVRMKDDIEEATFKKRSKSKFEGAG